MSKKWKFQGVSFVFCKLKERHKNHPAMATPHSFARGGFVGISVSPVQYGKSGFLNFSIGLGVGYGSFTGLQFQKTPVVGTPR